VDAIETATDIWKRDDERSLINILPTVVSNKLIEGSKGRPDLFGLDERTLFKTLRTEKKVPTPTDNRLRLAFWMEYDRAQASNKRMEILPIVAGICMPHYFYNEYLQRPEKVAWLVCPPASYEVVMEEGLQFGIEQLRDILEQPHVSLNSKNQEVVNVKLAELKAKIVAMLDVRVKGAPLQRIQQTSMNVNVSEKQISAAMTELTMDQIEKKLEDLRKRDRHQQVIELKPEET
jgi:hypothetical protein